MSTPNASCLSDWVQQLGLECLLRHGSRPRLIGNTGRAEHTGFHIRQTWPFSDQPGAGGIPLDPVFHGNEGTQTDDAVEESIPIGLSQRRREHSLGLIRLLLVALSSQNGPNST